MNIRWKLRMAAGPAGGVDRNASCGGCSPRRPGWSCRRRRCRRCSPGTRPGEAVHPGGVVHRAGVHPERPVRGRHHPGAAARRASAAASSGPAEGCLRPGPVDAAPVTSARRMAKRQRDCAGCGAPVGIIGREHCCRCWRKITEAAARAACPGCGKQRILRDATRRCVLCSRACAGAGTRSAATTPPCAGTAGARPGKPLPSGHARARPPGYLREGTGWCGTCSRPRQPKDPPRACAGCGQVHRHAGAGPVLAVLAASPRRPFVQAAHLAARLASPPDWLGDFIAHLAASHGQAAPAP